MEKVNGKTCWSCRSSIVSDEGKAVCNKKLPTEDGEAAKTCPEYKDSRQQSTANLPGSNVEYWRGR